MATHLGKSQHMKHKQLLYYRSCWVVKMLLFKICSMSQQGYARHMMIFSRHMRLNYSNMEYQKRNQVSRHCKPAWEEHKQAVELLGLTLQFSSRISPCQSTNHVAHKQTETNFTLIMTLHFHINLMTHKLSARSWQERGDKIRQSNMNTKQCASTDMICQ